MLKKEGCKISDFFFLEISFLFALMLLHNFFLYFSQFYLLFPPAANFQLSPLMLGSRDNLKHFIQMRFIKTPTYCHTLKLRLEFLQPNVRRAPGVVARRWAGNKETFSWSSFPNRRRPWERLAAEGFSRDWRDQAWAGMCDEEKVSRSEVLCTVQITCDDNQEVTAHQPPRGLITPAPIPWLTCEFHQPCKLARAH